MNDRIFDISEFNIIQDKDNYYFFRKLNSGDSNDIESGVVLEEGKVKKIRTDLERYQDTALYSKDDEISLEEVHDHVKWKHRKDTNCISFSMNANVVSSYGRSNRPNQYVMVTVPKDKFSDNGFYLTGKFLIDEIYRRIEELIEKQYFDEEKIKYLNSVKNATTNEELFSILEEYSNLSSNDYKFNQKKFYDFYTLNEKQNLEKNKLIAELDIINRRLLSRCSNILLLESLKFAFTSSEVIHYKNVDKNFIFVSPTTIDLFSLLQQAVSMGVDKDKIEKLQLKVIQCAKENLYVKNGKYGEFHTDIKNYMGLNDDIKISDIYELTGGKIPFSKAYKALQFSLDIANSKLKTNDLCNLLKEMADSEELNSIIDEINSKCYTIKPSFISRNLQAGLKLSDSICLSINGDKKQFFSFNEQNSILNYINSLNREEKIKFLQQNGNDNEKLLCDLLNPSYNHEISLNRYYAETILDFLNLDQIYNASYLQKTLSDEEKENILSYLEKANCINMFDSLNNLGLDSSDISAIIINLLLSNGYHSLNFIDLSNSENFKEIISNNLENINSKVSALRLDYFLGVKDNDNHVIESNINLRDYQKWAVDRVDEIFETKNFAGVVLPTGAGKSFVAITEMLKYKDQNIIYYAPNREILRQLQKHILKHVLNINVISEAEETYYLEHPDKIQGGYIFQKDIDDMIKAAFPQFNMYCYQGLTTKEDEFFETRNAGLIVLDEVHRTGAQEWNEKIKILIKNNPRAKILGITATPIRDVDNQNMVEKLAEFSGAYTNEEIKKKKYMAAEMYLVDAMQEGIVVTPNIVTFDYSLENSEQYKEVKRMYESETNLYKKEELKKVYDDMRKIIEVSQKKGMANIIKDGFEKNHKPLNGRYIVFLPPNSNGKIPTEEYILGEIEKVKEYFKEVDSNPEIGYLLSDRKSKYENSIAINKFENDSEHLKLIFAINMLNEGVHVDGIDGVIMLRPLGAGNKILYYQQIGRCIYSLDPNYELEPSEFPVIFDVYNNYLEQNMDRQVNRHTSTSDLQKLYLIKEWINKHFRYPDINSESIDEARKAITLKRIQKKYFKYIDDSSYNSNLTATEIYEIEEIVRVGLSIDLWNIEIPERTIDPKERDIEQFATFKLKGEQKEFVDLFRKASEITANTSAKSKQLRLIDTLNILDVMAEYDVDINNKNIPMGCILQNIYSTIPDDILKLIKEEISINVGYELGKEYNEAKKQFYKKNPVFLDYDIATLRKMGIFEPCNIYEGFKNIDIIDQKGFIIHGPAKFLKLNIYTGTYFDSEGLNIDGLNEQNFSYKDGFFNKYNFGRDGYYYELTDDGEHIKTDSIYNPYGFDIKGDYYKLQADGTYKNLGKIDTYGFDIDGFYYKYNKITKEYIKTKSIFDDRGFDRDGIFCTNGEYVERKTRILEYSDGLARTFEDITYFNNTSGKSNQYSIFSTSLPYDLNYFDRDGYYYILDEFGNRVKSNLIYNERYLDAHGYYYELQPDGTRKKTDRTYDENFYGLDGYYYELQPDGTRIKTNSLTNNNGLNYMGLNIKYTLNSKSEQKKKLIAFDKDDYCYEYINGKFVKIDPPTKISKFGFDNQGYYHKLQEDGTRNPVATKSKVDEHGFDECGLYNGKLLDNYGFDREGYWWMEKGIYKTRVKTDRKTDEYGFDWEGMFDFILPNGTKVKKIYNDRFFSRDGFYYELQSDGARIKTDRKTDNRGFDLSKTHYDVTVDVNTKEYIYNNPLPYDEHGFDVDGIYYEKIKRFYTPSKKDFYDRIKTNPPSILDEHGFNYKGFYCERVNGQIIETDSKYTPYGFDIDGYYIELDANGKKTMLDSYNFDIDGYHYVLRLNGTMMKTSKRFDDSNHTQGYYNDIKKETKEEIKESQKGLENSNIEEIKIPLGFNKTGNFIANGEETKYDARYFDINGYYYELQEDGTRTITDKQYNPDGFDKEGYYYELQEDGTRIKTDKKYNPDGIDFYGFKQDGIHNTTNLEYDENYFRQDGINIITGTEYSLTGYNIYGIFNEDKVSSYASKHMYDMPDKELVCVRVAKRALELPIDKIDNAITLITEDNIKNKKELKEKLYKYIIAAAVIDSNVKEKLIDYVSNLLKEAKKLSAELKIEKAKADKDADLIKEYEKKLAKYKEISKKTEIGGTYGRNI